jgi:hypothetical protein
VHNIGKCGHGTSLYSVVSINLVGSGPNHEMVNGDSLSDFMSPPQLFAAPDLCRKQRSDRMACVQDRLAASIV